MAVRANKRFSVRRLFVRDPYNKNSSATTATFGSNSGEFTNNPNPLYDPSKAPGSPAEVSVASVRKGVNKPGKAARGHQKVVPPNRQTLFGGKTLKRRSF